MSGPLPDEVLDVLAPYSGFVRVWRMGGCQVRQGTEVPSVGMTGTYAVMLDGVGPPRFVWVHDNKITAPMAHKPIIDADVFDARGSYLGRGGGVLEAPSTGAPVESLVERVLASQSKTSAAKETPPEPKKNHPEQRMVLPHRFHLRKDFVVHLDLPWDLTSFEVARLTKFLEALPFGSEAEE
jgi:hypothetical protein